MKKFVSRLLVIGTLTLAAHAADQATASAGGNYQPSMNNYDLSGMDGPQKRRMADAVASQQKQLGHGMGGLETTPGHKTAHKAKRKARKHKTRRH